MINNLLLDENEFVRNFLVLKNGDIDIFLGAGASISSGIPTGQDLIWYFKKQIYCTENNISPDRFRDLNIDSVRKLFQDYFDAKGNYPPRWSKDEYSFYFEKCYNSREARKNFIDSIVARRKPSDGYLCLGNLILDSRINNVWTTNFDNLVETAINQLDFTFVVNNYSSSNAKSLSLSNSYPSIYKLHGDFRYDYMQNTSEELKALEGKIYESFLNKLMDKALLVIGYSGTDNSIMNFFENNASNERFLNKGLFWAIKKGSSPSARVFDLLKKMIQNGKEARLIEIDGFDDFFHKIYLAENDRNEIIDKIFAAKVKSEELSFNAKQSGYFIKLNAYEEYNLPLCMTFETDITKWAQLREVIDETDIIAALYRGKIYCFGDKDAISRVFGKHIKTEILEEMVPSWLITKTNSIYLGLLYDLIDKCLVSNGYVPYKRHKYYDPNSKESDSYNVIYDAIGINLSCNNNKIYLNLLPTKHITKLTGARLDKLEYQYKLNLKLSRIHNKEYDILLKKWRDVFKKKLENANWVISFSYNNYTVNFSLPDISCGGTNRDQSWIELSAFSFEEPIMSFSRQDINSTSVNQLRGLIQYGPLDRSVFNSTDRNIRLALLTPKPDAQNILSHLANLDRQSRTKYQDNFIVEYPGFQKVFRCRIVLPSLDDYVLCRKYDIDENWYNYPKSFVDFLKSQIDAFSALSTNFEILVIYIPNSLKEFREHISMGQDFNLHDEIKIYAMKKGVPIQFVEQKSLTADTCKVNWGLSTGLYTKALCGMLWQPSEVISDTAYIGLSYASSKEKGICIGCSQLFDSSGSGMKMVLRKIKNPIYVGKESPYMNRDEARSMIGALREQYYRSCPTAKLSRIVVHKTTPFMKEEIIGILQALEGVDDIELLQIQEFSSWRGIRFGTSHLDGVASFPVFRGTAVRLADDSFLLWTHGSVVNRELGYGNYFKGGRGIPVPLLIKRYYGNGKADILAKEILTLTKMNWNSGDSLYKILPVTLDFAKIVSRMSKQNEQILDDAYDFRFFM